MKKLKTVIEYECTTSFKYVWIFYLIQYAVMGLIITIAAISTGSLEEVGTSSLEMNTFIYIGILGILGFTDDFKMLLQNGFTRQYIFLGTISLFIFISGIMSLVDAVIGNALHHIFSNYTSLFGSLYGYDHIFMNWIWLFLMNMLVCSFFYLGILILNKIGKKLVVYLGITLGCLVLLVVALFRFVFSNEFVNTLAEIGMKAMGFMKDGTINFLFPILTLLLFVGVLSICSYHIIRRTELKG